MAATPRKPEMLNDLKARQTMIESADVVPAPKRLTLGGNAYHLVHTALTERLSTLEAQKDIALLADRAGVCRHVK